MTDEAKEKWIEDNRQAYGLFEHYAYSIAITGKKFGFKAVAERVRWESYISIGKDYKWSNSVTTYAGRKFINKYPQFRNQVTFKGQNK